MCSIFAAQPCKAKRVSKEIFDNSIRDNYQVDRDRILYSKAFRRLRGKTQIFIAGYDDHVRNRLSHTLEVSQIAQTISKALGLNEMLTEAIALGHDIGHTPFGHVGERTLHKISTGDLEIPERIKIQKNKISGFKHNWQSVRVACVLEYHNRDFAGLNLTKETLWGFLHHSKLGYGGSIVDFYKNIYSPLLPDEECWTFEALIVSLADEIAQRHHDIEDGLITGILDKDKLIDYLENVFKGIDNSHVENFKELLIKAKKEKYPEFYLETLARAIVNFYVCVVVDCTKILFDKMERDYSLTDSNSFYSKKKEIWEGFIKSEKDFVKQMMSNALYNADSNLQEDYFKKRILHCYQAQKNDGKAGYVIKKIVEAYMTNPQQMPDNAIIMLFANLYGIDDISKQKEVMEKIFAEGKDKSEIVGEFRVKLADEMAKDEKMWKQNELYKVLPRTIIDYIAGMTDDYALAIYEQLYGGGKQNRY
jgi:dGTPase